MQKPKENTKPHENKMLVALGEIKNDIALMQDRISILEKQKQTARCARCNNCGGEGHVKIAQIRIMFPRIAKVVLSSIKI